MNNKVRRSSVIIVSGLFALILLATYFLTSGSDTPQTLDFSELDSQKSSSMPIGDPASNSLTDKEVIAAMKERFEVTNQNEIEELSFYEPNKAIVAVANLKCDAVGNCSRAGGFRMWMYYDNGVWVEVWSAGAIPSCPEISHIPENYRITCYLPNNYEHVQYNNYPADAGRQLINNE